MTTKETTFIQCGMFNGLDNNALADCMAGITLHNYKKGEILIEKDKQSTGLFIIHTGSVGIYNEDILLAQLGPATIIGESFIAGTPATASSITLEETEVFIVLKDDFFRMIKNYPQIIQNLFSQTINRLRNSNDAALAEARSRTEQLKILVEERTAELQNTLTELNHTQQFRDQFLANMSHEIRTPMNAIVGLTNLLVQSPLNKQQEKYLQVIKKSGDNLIVIINDILDLSKIEAGKMELEMVPFTLHQTLENIKTILEIKAIEKGIALKLDIQENVPEFVVGDETRLTQILINLTGNAIKFTDSGAVTIAAKLENTSGRMAKIHFSVEDSGIGIPEDKLVKIFESFGQASADTTRKYGGTGLGLSISKQLVELYDGKLQVKSTVGKGSTFYFSIPLEISEAPKIELPEAPSSDSKLSQLQILLVEDNLFNQMVAQDTLEVLFPGCKVDLAENGKTAIALASSNMYNIILMDIRLPDIDGFEITKFIRKELDHPKNSVPICAMTASVSKERIDECMNAGMNDYMYKPFTQEELKQKVISNIQTINKPERYEHLKQFILQKQKNELAPYLKYHSAEHIIDVLQSAELIGRMELINAKDMELLKVAVLFHDIGFTISSIEHEKSSCTIAEKVLPEFGYLPNEIDVILHMIMSTRIPQTPTNKLEQIICDADLDYLGREDYYATAEKLREELEYENDKFTPETWNKLQEVFLEQHQYFTNTSRQLRNNKKMEHLSAIKHRKINW